MGWCSRKFAGGDAMQRGLEVGNERKDGRVARPLKRVRLELARNAEFPEGSSEHGYELVAPLTEDGHLDLEGWKQHRNSCTVRRFWTGDEEAYGHLVHHAGRRWAFRYQSLAADDEEPIFRLDRHSFVVGEYVSITENDGVQRTFRVVSVGPAVAVA
jgi:hypothetical protein